MMIIIVFSDGWGNAYGGINTLNTQFCTELKKYNERTKASIGLIVVTCGASEQEEAVFNLNNVYMLNVKKDSLYYCEQLKDLIEEKIRLVCLEGQESELFFVGHDVYTGEIAEKFAEAFHGKSLVFHHMAYAEYQDRLEGDEGKLLEKISRQKSVLAKADVVLGVGPKLYNSAISIVKNEGGTGFVTQIIPGFDMIEQGDTDSNQFRLFFSGRIEFNDVTSNNRIKQYDLVVKAFCELVNEGRLALNSKLYLIGLDDDTKAKEHVNTLKGNITNKDVSIQMHKYMEREQLISIMRGTDIVILPSLDEGFGLVGVEAISAGVPLIVTKNSGLYKFLQNQELSNSVHAIDITGDNEESVNAVKSMIIKIKEDEVSCRRCAKILQEELCKKWSWENIIERFIKFLSYVKFYRISKTEFQIALKNNILFDKENN